MTFFTLLFRFLAGHICSWDRRLNGVSQLGPLAAPVPSLGEGISYMELPDWKQFLTQQFWELYPGSMEKCVIEKHGLMINPFEQIVVFKEKEIPFTTREFDILYLLMEHCGQVLSKEQIYSRVADSGGREDYHTIEITISRIRKKLYEGTGRRDLIQTRYGSGYKFVK